MRVGSIKKEKERLLQLIQTLDIRAETNLLDPTEQACKSEAEAKLRSLLREEEMKWALRAKVLKVVKGDDNT